MNLDAASNGVEVLDRHGDLKLIAGEDRVVFRVCSRTLARSSPFWEILLYGPFSEGKAQQKTNNWEVQLPEDTPAALRIILLAVHYRLNEIPRGRMDINLLFRTIELCDKYDMIAALEPFWNGWLPLTSERALAARAMSPRQLGRRIWLFHRLGDMARFQAAILALVRRATILDDGQLCLDGDKDSS